MTKHLNYLLFHHYNNNLKLLPIINHLNMENLIKLSLF